MNKQTNVATIQTHNIDNGLQLLTIPTRVHGFLNEKMKLAVAKLNSERKEGERELTVADFLRMGAAEKVARVLGEEVAELPPVVRGRGGSMTAQLAKKLGISQEELGKRAAELIASQHFGYKVPGLEVMEEIISGKSPVIGGAPQASRSHQSGQHRITGTQTTHNGRQVRKTA